MKTETKIEKSIQNAVNDCLAGLDHLPSQEEEILQKLETSRLHANQGLYRDADEVIADLRVKYGL